jgi:hypothetical protein
VLDDHRRFCALARCPPSQASLLISETTTGRGQRCCIWRSALAAPRDQGPEAGAALPAGPQSGPAPAFACFGRHCPYPRHTEARYCCYGRLIRSCYGSIRARSWHYCSTNRRAALRSCSHLSSFAKQFPGGFCRRLFFSFFPSRFSV